MKKLMLLAMLLFVVLFTSAQNTFQLYIDDIEPHQQLDFCLGDYDTIVVVDTNCNYSYDYHWYVFSLIGVYDDIVDEPIVRIPIDENFYCYEVTYQSCDEDRFTFEIWFHGFSSPDPWLPDYAWKHEDETISLTAHEAIPYYFENNPYYWDYEWSTGENSRLIYVSNPGIYWSRLYNFCGEAIDSVEVRNGVEISIAFTDLASNMNEINWLVDEAQSAYIAEVNIYRNNQLVGTAPYTEGSFLDNIGSEATQWQYHIVGVTNGGQECPVPSYWKRPIHLDHLQGQINHVLQWTSYQAENGADIVAYRICDWFEGELRLVTEVGGFVNTFNYNPEDILGDAVVVAVLSSGELSYSNRVPIHLGIAESNDNQFYVYPNPAKDRVTIEGTGIMIVTNTSGQIVMVKEIDREETVALPQGLYFVKMNGVTHKIVVE